jgi:hypothetical protein
MSILSSVNTQLATLENLLNGLPESIPKAKEGAEKYNFINYTPDPERVDHYGSKASALNNYLEITFAKHGRDKASGGIAPFRLLERGPGLTAVVGVIRSALIEEGLGNAVLTKWVRDLAAAARYEIMMGIHAPAQPVRNIHTHAYSFCNCYLLRN